jgi:hypothetical protein
MTNRIRRITLRSHSTVPASAEIRVYVLPERRTPRTEIRGRLMGPSCPYASTVEVAYPLCPLPGAPEGDELSARVIVPEASLWEPVSPFLYAGPVELWEDGQLCERVTVRHGLRSLSLGPRGLRINGHVLTLRGSTIDEYTEAEAAALHRGGYNLLVAPASAAAIPLWDLADRLGFLMIGRLTEDDEWSALPADLMGRACCLGFLLPPGAKQNRPLPADLRVGVEITAADTIVPEGAAFVICPHPDMAPAGRPFLIRGAAPVPSAPLLVGQIETLGERGASTP